MIQTASLVLPAHQGMAHYPDLAVCEYRGMRLTPGKALAEVFPAARHQRCWVHKARNVTNALPKSAHLVAVVRAGGRFENGILVERTGVAA